MSRYHKSWKLIAQAHGVRGGLPRSRAIGRFHRRGTKSGYDGIIIPDTLGGPAGLGFDSYIAFEPSQIKQINSPVRVVESMSRYHAASTRFAIEHGPTFRDWQVKARRTIQDAFSSVEEDDGSDWFAIAKSALAATLPHVMYRGFSVPAVDAVEAKRLGVSAMRSTRKAVPHSFSEAVARSFAIGVEPWWAAAGTISDEGKKHRDKTGQWGVIVSVNVGPDMVDWSCIDDGGAIFGEQVYDHLPFDKPVGEAIADILVESGGTHNTEWDLRVKPYPPKSATIEVFQIASGDTGKMEGIWQKWEDTR